MKSTSAIAIAIPVFFAYIAYRYYDTNIKSKVPVNCHTLSDGTFPANTPGECFFSDSYQDARLRFRALASAAGAELHELPVYEGLTTDVAVLRGKNPSRSILHLSGVHGQEGYAGSAVQCAALNYFAKSKNAPNVTITFIHAVNPYGFHYDRRVNEDNIDINRNFLTEEQFHKAVARDPNFAGYVDADSLLNPPEPLSDNWLWNDISQYKNLVTGVVFLGYGQMKKAMVSGNYWKPKGIGYGGSKLAKSTQNVLEVFRSQSFGINTKDNDGTIVIDVHTGLGPEGVDTLMVSKDVDLRRLERIFPTEYAGGNEVMQKKGIVVGAIKEHPGGSHTGAMSGYEETIGTTDALCSTFSNSGDKQIHEMCVTQEFGTKMGVFVGKALVQENQAFWSDSQSLRTLYGKELRNAFKLEKASWKRSVVRRGMNLLMQATSHLSNPDTDMTK